MAYTPKYTLTKKILVDLNASERLYGRLDGIVVPNNLLLNLERENLIQSSFSSNRIEGNKLSQYDVTNLILDERTPVSHDEFDVKNYYDILRNLQSISERKLDLNLILDLHRMLFAKTKPQMAGKIRNIEVVIGRQGSDGKWIIRHTPPTSKVTEIERKLQSVLKWVNESDDLPIIKCAIFHHYFVYIHPFEDGNGRVCRIMTSLLFLKFGYEINRYFILDDYYDTDRNNYSAMLHTADGGDLTQWIEYFIEGVRRSLESSVAKIEIGLQASKVSLRPTKGEQRIVEILKRKREVTSSDVASDLNVSRQQAHNLLSGVVAKGYVVPVGRGKASYYKIR